MRLISFIILSTVIGMLLLSCAGDQSQTAPDITQSASQSTASGSEKICWGIWDVFIDPETASVELAPFREASFTVNIVNFLQPPSSQGHLLAIEIDPIGTDFANGLVTCDVTIHHPLPGTKFCGFDVMGIVMDDYPASIPFGDPTLTLSLPPATLLQNADGWTRWWNQAEFTSYGTIFGYTEGALANHGWASTHSLNAYKYFCDDLASQDPFNPDPDARGFFSASAPCNNSRRYVLQFPVDGGPVLHFKYAISANYKFPYGVAVAPYTPDDFPPDANMPEAYKISILNAGSTAYYENESTFGGDLNLYVEVRDWQFNGDIGSVTDEIQAITIVSPTLFSTPVHLDLGQAILVPNNPTAIRVPVLIGNVKPTAVDDQLLVVAVKCMHPQTYEPQISGGAFAYPSGPLVAYGICEAPIIAQGLEHPWPKFRRNFSRTGSTGAIGPTTDNVKFTWEVPISYGGIFGGFVVDSQGRVIVPSTNIYCLEPDGELAWAYPATAATYSSPSVAPDDSIYVGHHVSSGICEIHHFDKNGVQIWVGQYGYNAIDGGIAVQSDGSILFGTWEGVLVKTDSLGNELWAYDTGEPICGGATIGDDGTIYIATHEDHVYAINQGGNKVWMTDCGYSDMCAPPALGPLGIYVGSMSGTMYCLNYNGTIKWYKKVSTGGGIHHGVAVGDDGNIYFGSYNHYVYCMSQATATVIWEYKTSHEITTTSPVLDGANHLYVGNIEGDFYCLTTGGDLVWVKDIGGDIRSKSPAIGSDGTLYIGSTSGSVYAFNDE